MSVSLLLVMLADEALNVGVRSALPVFHWEVLAAHNGKANLEILVWLLVDLPDFADIRCLVCWVNIDPHIHDALVKRAAHVVELTSLNRLLIDGLPLWVEESVIQIN